MFKKINCIYNNKGAWCTNQKIKKSLFGIGARCCSEHNDIDCDEKVEHTKKENIAPPAPIQKPKN